MYSTTTTNRAVHAPRPAALAALVLVVALLATLLTPGKAEARTTVPVRSLTEVSFANAVATLLNTERAANHLKPVTMRPQLIASARSHNLAMARANVMSHQVYGEKSLGSRIDATGYHWLWAGENIGWNSDMTSAGVLMLQKAMYNERPPENGHRLNILSSHFTNVGVDVYLDTVHQRVWLTVDFGRL